MRRILSSAIPTACSLFLGLLVLAGCAPPRNFGAEAAWLNTYNRWNRSLDSLNAVSARDAPGAISGFRLLRDSTRAAIDTLDRVRPGFRTSQAPLLFTLLQRVRFNVLATEHRRLSARRDQLAELARRADSSLENGDFPTARQWCAVFERGADSLGLSVTALLDQDLRSAWDTLRIPLPSDSSRRVRLAPRLRVDGDSIPPDVGEIRGRLEQVKESTDLLARDSAARRPASVRRGWVRLANVLVERLNAAVRVDSAGAHRDALRRLTALRTSADSTRAALEADTTRWPGRVSGGGVSSRPSRSPAPQDPGSAVRDVLRLVDLNEEAIHHGLAVDLYQDISRRLAIGDMRPRADAARLDSVLAYPRLDPDLRRMITGLRKDLKDLEAAGERRATHVGARPPG